MSKDGSLCNREAREHHVDVSQSDLQRFKLKVFLLIDIKLIN